MQPEHTKSYRPTQEQMDSPRQSCEIAFTTYRFVPRKLSYTAMGRHIDKPLIVSKG